LLAIYFLNIFLECWNNEPDNRPSMNQVVTKLKDIITKTNITSEIDQIGQLSNEPQRNLKKDDPCPSPDSSLHGELSQMIKNFHKINTNEIEPTTVSNQASVTSYKIIEKQCKLYINYYYLIILKLKKRSLANIIIIIKKKLIKEFYLKKI